MAAQASNLKVAIDTAATATSALRVTVQALEQIANLQQTCPLAAELAVDAIRTISEQMVDGVDRELDGFIADQAVGAQGVPDRLLADVMGRVGVPCDPERPRLVNVLDPRD